jgi:DNA helicase-2/ATP-dependent DNA helicase PcrA
MMTIHSSKGLEFPHVYIVGLEENLFPSQMSVNSRSDLEEERRLFYVAVTRAEKKLTLSYATSRYRWGTLTNCEPSRFLDEIEPKYLETNFLQRIPERNGSGLFGEERDSFTSVSGKPKIMIPKSKPAPVGSRAHVPSENFVADDPAAIQVGMEVEHQRFGLRQGDLAGRNRSRHQNNDIFQGIRTKATFT